MPQLALGTIDGFFHRVLGMFSLEYGLSGEFEIMDEFTAQRARLRALDQLFAAAAASEADRQALLKSFELMSAGQQDRRIYDVLEQYLRDCHSVYHSAPGNSAGANPKRFGLKEIHGLFNRGIQRHWCRPFGMHWKRRPGLMTCMRARGRRGKRRRTIFSNGSLVRIYSAPPRFEKGVLRIESAGIRRLDVSILSERFPAGRGISAILGCVIATLFGGRIQPAAGADAWGVCHVARIRRPL